MAESSAVELFNAWAKAGRDEGMEKGHYASVLSIIDIVRARLPQNFSAIDIGCGNGWLVRELQKAPDCNKSTGVDGSYEMIAKARKTNPEGDYVLAGLPNWAPADSYDLAISMEFMYYLEDPFSFLKTIHDDWLGPKGCLAFGIDHYAENPSSLSWPSSLGLELATLSEKDWVSSMWDAGFTNVESSRVEVRENWSGTLVVVGSKN